MKNCYLTKIMIDRLGFAVDCSEKFRLLKFIEISSKDVVFSKDKKTFSMDENRLPELKETVKMFNERKNDGDCVNALRDMGVGLSLGTIEARNIVSSVAETWDSTIHEGWELTKRAKQNCCGEIHAKWGTAFNLSQKMHSLFGEDSYTIFLDDVQLALRDAEKMLKKLFSKKLREKNIKQKNWITKLTILHILKICPG